MYFERFYNIKQEIIEKDNIAATKKLIADDKRYTFEAMSDVLYQKTARYIYQIKIDEAKLEHRLKLFIGEAGKLVKTKYN